MNLKAIFISISVFCVFLLASTSVSADDFTTKMNTRIELLDEGHAQFAHQVSIQNDTTENYLTDFILKLSGFEPEDVQVRQGGKNLRAVEIDNDSTTSVLVKFDDPLVGKGKTREFVVEYELANFATKSGEVWEFQVPRLEENHQFDEYSLEIDIPKDFGRVAYIQPHPEKEMEDEFTRILTYGKDTLEKTDVIAGFGTFQIYSLRLQYRLKNDGQSTETQQVAFPPTTSYQTLFYRSIVPEPELFYEDDDGNWIGEYTLKPGEEKEIVAEATAQVFGKVNTSEEEVTQYLEPSAYWHSDDPKIAQIGEFLRTPKEIYSYVTTNLSYDYSVRDSRSRRGALEVLTNPAESICTDFSDLFIALARSAGIPAREIQGYAVAGDPLTEPVSLSGDVLHSWVEYWDKDTKEWILIDPTWGATTGKDYFSEFDFKHITFVVHGKDPVYPLPPGAYESGTLPQKDVFVGYGELPIQRLATVTLSTDMGSSFVFESKTARITLHNDGPVEVTGKRLKVYFDDELVHEIPVETILPFSTQVLEVDIPVGFMVTEAPHEIIFQIGTTTQEVVFNKTSLLIIHFSGLVSIALVIVVVFLLRRPILRRIRKN